MGRRRKIGGDGEKVGDRGSGKSLRQADAWSCRVFGISIQGVDF